MTRRSHRQHDSDIPPSPSNLHVYTPPHPCHPFRSPLYHHFLPKEQQGTNVWCPCEIAGKGDDIYGHAKSLERAGRAARPIELKSDDIAPARHFLFSPPPTPAEQVELEFAARARRAHPFERRRPRRRTRGRRRRSRRPVDLDRSRTRASLFCCCCCHRGRRRRLDSRGFLLLLRLEALPFGPGRVRLVRRRQRRHRVRVALRQRRKQGRSPLGRSRSTPAATSRSVEVRGRTTFRDGRSARRRDEAAAVLFGEDMAGDRHRCTATRCYTSCDRRWRMFWWWRRQGRRVGSVVGRDRPVEVPRSEK